MYVLVEGQPRERAIAMSGARSVTELSKCTRSRLAQRESFLRLPLPAELVYSDPRYILAHNSVARVNCGSFTSSRKRFAENRRLSAVRVPELLMPGQRSRKSG